MRKPTRENAVPPGTPEPHAHALDAEALRVDPLLAYAMIRASRVAAILVGCFRPPRLDAVLQYVKELHQGTVCWVDISEIDLSDNATRSWTDAQHGHMGRPAGAPVRPGYYLFLEGQVSAYNSGLIDFKRDKLSLGVGIATAIAALHWQSTSLPDRAFFAASFQASVRVAQCFEAAITRQRQHTTHQVHHQAPPPVPEEVDELGLAFEYESAARGVLCIA